MKLKEWGVGGRQVVIEEGDEGNSEAGMMWGWMTGKGVWCRLEGKREGGEKIFDVLGH